MQRRSELQPDYSMGVSLQRGSHNENEILRDRPAKEVRVTKSGGQKIINKMDDHRRREAAHEENMWVIWDPFDWVCSLYAAGNNLSWYRVSAGTLELFSSAARTKFEEYLQQISVDLWEVFFSFVVCTRSRPKVMARNLWEVIP